MNNLQLEKDVFTNKTRLFLYLVKHDAHFPELIGKLYQ